MEGLSVTISGKDFTTTNEISYGGYGKVFDLIGDGRTFAVKVFKDGKFGTTEQARSLFPS